MAIRVLLASVLLSFVLVLVPVRASDCTNGFTRVGSKCYYVSFKKTDWHVADRNCRKLGADLMVITDEQDKELTTAYLKSLGLPLASWRDSVWVGINCLGDRRNFTLSKTGDPIPYLEWCPTQPDNAVPEEDCLAFGFHHTFAYHDIQCKTEFQFVCEKPLTNNYLSLKEELFSAATF